jgi:hypothetical protein
MRTWILLAALIAGCSRPEGRVAIAPTDDQPVPTASTAASRDQLLGDQPLGGGGGRVVEPPEPSPTPGYDELDPDQLLQ